MTLFLHIWMWLDLQPPFSLMMEKTHPVVSRKPPFLLLGNMMTFGGTALLNRGFSILFSVAPFFPIRAPPSPPSHLQQRLQKSKGCCSPLMPMVTMSSCKDHPGFC